jgi:hypothetical protein
MAQERRIPAGGSCLAVPYCGLSTSLLLFGAIPAGNAFVPGD